MQKHDLDWIKAQRSYGSGACVELARDGDLVALRNSREPGVEMRVAGEVLAAFLDGAKRGEFDHLLRKE